jgi:DNA-directed RNA polymerase specialized sigma24 family protein
MADMVSGHRREVTVRRRQAVPPGGPSFDEFVRVHGDALVRLSYALCGDRAAAEDAAQDALTRLYLRWGRLDEPLSYARRCVVMDPGREDDRKPAAPEHS